MNEKCFCHFNGFEVKDAAARKAVETAKFYFPSEESGAQSDSTAIMVTSGKCVLFDCGYVDNWENIKAYYSALYDQGVFSNIDAVIISHYHGDHVQNFTAILDLFPHEGCTVYLPMDPQPYFTGEKYEKVNEYRATMIEALQHREITYTEVTDETFVIDIVSGFCDITLFNSNAADYAYYAANTDNYNNYSMCALVRTGEIYSMFPGDIEHAAQKRIVNTRNLPRLFLYAVHHHGIQNDDYHPYMDAIRPEHGVISNAYGTWLRNADASMMANYAVENLYSTAYSSVEIITQKTSGAVIKGKKLDRAGWKYNPIVLYVDNSAADTIRNGSEEHPFTEICEAVAFMKENSNLVYTVNVKATAQPYEGIAMYNLKNQITLQGVALGDGTLPKVNGARFTNCSDVRITGFEFAGEGNTNKGIKNIIFLESSTVEMNGCKITGSSNTEADALVGVLMAPGTELYFAAGTITNCYDGFKSYKFSRVQTTNVSFVDCAEAYAMANMELLVRGEDTLTNTPVYMKGDKDKGTAPTFTTRAAASAIAELVAKNSSAVVSNPFMWMDHGMCIAYGQKVYKLATTEIAE